MAESTETASSSGAPSSPTLAGPSSASDSVIPTLASLSIQSATLDQTAASTSSANGNAVGQTSASAIDTPAVANTSRHGVPTDGGISAQPNGASADAATAGSSSIHTSEAAMIAAIKCRDYASPKKASMPLAEPSASASPANGLASAAASTSATAPTASAPDSAAPAASSSPASTSTSATQIPRSNTPSSRPPMPSSASSSAIRRPGPGGQGLASRIPPSLQAKMAAMASRSNNPSSQQLAGSTHLGSSERLPTSNILRQSSTGSTMGASPGGSPSLGPQGGPGRPFGAPTGAPGRVGAMGPASGARPQPALGGMSRPGAPGALGGMAKRRGPAAGLNLAAMGANGAGEQGVSEGANGATENGKAGRPPMRLPSGSGATTGGTPFSNFSKIVDPSGSLNFENKAVLHAKGVDFTSGASFKINMDELELQEELGSGNYGTVKKVYHKVTKVTMAMKEIRLELDDSKLKGIITELDILHRATAPEIVEFYGAFFIESCVYYCMEYMDALSLDKLSVIDVPEPVLARVTASMVRGLKFLKDKLQIMHRDVKPTNVLVNTAGSVKLCDFGVSGQLERSLAKTNIGCQSYMAPERIKGESQNFLGTYTVSSDVWSLGLSLIEFTLGRYPYPPETYSNVFAQLTAIVHGDPPTLPPGFSKVADDFVAQCLQKEAHKRPTYAMLLRHPFLAGEETKEVDMVGWVRAALDQRTKLRNTPPSTSNEKVGQ